MNDENRKSVPNLSREELNAKLDELRQKEAKHPTTRRSFVRRFVLALLSVVTFGWLGGCKKPKVLCYKVAPKDDGDDIQPMCYEPAIPEEEMNKPEEEPTPTEEPAPAEEPAQVEETPKEADGKDAQSTAEDGDKKPETEEEPQILCYDVAE